MRRFAANVFRRLFGKELELRVKIFHVLALTGVLICIPAAVVSLFQGLFVNTAIISVSCVCSLLLLIYSAMGGRQEICYWGTIISIFLTLFPSMFLFGGGYKSGIVFFFVFAVVYTVYMLSGWQMVAMVMFELIYYSGFCVYAYLYPDKILPLSGEADLVIDVIACFIIASVALGCTMLVQFRMYQQQQKELEQARVDAEVASRAKGTFLANMSHEIRTPIHVIMSLNELIRMENENPQISACSEKIQNACELLRGLLDNILDMSKIEAGKTTLNIAPYRTSELVRTLELVGRSRCDAKQLEFKCINENLPEALGGDMIQVQQIAMNLLNNAVKYTERGEVTVSLSCKAGDTPETVLLRIVVADTGIGIDPDALPGLFETFSRADQPAGKHIEGTGLGLAIVKELCRLMKGTIHVESQKGWGSTFTVELPQRTASVGEVPDSNMRSFAAPACRVLLVDDSAENLSVMSALLRKMQLQVDTAISGSEAVKKAADNTYHVILLDYMMPGMDGIETLRQLRLREDFATPVIALTADAVAGTRERLLAAGFSEYIKKPIKWGHLGNLLIQYLPPQLVTVTGEAVPLSKRAELLCEQLQPMLASYYIDLSAAMPYFSGDMGAYLQTADIFLAHAEDGCRTLAQLQQPAEAPALIYAVHALKGRAKNLGLVALAEEAQRMELLCKEERHAEAQSYIPHLLYLYRQATEGLALLQSRLADVSEASGTRAYASTVEDCRSALQVYLDSLQRKPALDCIDRLLEMEPSVDIQTELHKMRVAVAAVHFEEAGAIYAAVYGG